MRAVYNFRIIFLNGHRLERSTYACSEEIAHKEVWSALSNQQQKDIERMDLVTIIYDSLSKGCE